MTATYILISREEAEKIEDALYRAEEDGVTPEAAEEIAADYSKNAQAVIACPFADEVAMDGGVVTATPDAREVWDGPVPFHDLKQALYAAADGRFRLPERPDED